MAILKSGYEYVRDKKRKRNNYKHRMVMESLLGRNLSKDEQVHHINGNKLDNNIENLQLCESIATHRNKHKERGPIKYKFCTIDGCKNTHHGKGFCRKHYAQKYRKGQGW